VNVDISAIAEGNGDFRYGLVLRRSGDQYYAFTVSPTTKKWYFLKSSSDGPEILREGTDERMRGVDARETLRMEAYGSTFLLFINGRFIDWISDSDYATGEVGLYVETIDSSDTLIRFDSIIIWDVPPVTLIPNTGGREYCFNARDDDGDRLIDRADPDCQRQNFTSTSLPLPTNTLMPQPTSTLGPTHTPRPPNTATLPPTGTRKPTHTPKPTPTATDLPPPTATDPPAPTATDLPPPTATAPPAPTATDPPAPTATDPPVPTATAPPVPTATAPPTT
jgi:hypothetical protein